MNIYREHLLNVARACRESPDAALFTMRFYGYSCGTPGCALGHYAARDDLQSTFALIGGWVIAIKEGAQRLDTCACKPVVEHFGIDAGEALMLFGTNGCGGARTPEAAASYIESFVERKWPLTSGADYAEYCRWRHERCRVDADGVMNSHGPDGGRASSARTDGDCACGRGFRVGPTYHWRDDKGVCHSRERCA